MKWSFSFLAVVLFWAGAWTVSAVSAPEEAPSRVDLETAKKFAVENSPEVVSLRRALEEKQASVQAQRSNFFPSLGIAGGPEANPGGTNALSGITGYAFAQYNLFRGFRDSYQMEIADIDEEIARIKLKKAEFRVGLDLEEYFHKFHLIKVSIALREDALKQNEVHRGMARARASSGMAATSDIIEFEMKEALIKSDLELLHQELEEVRIRLRKLLGEEVGGAIEPIGGLQHQHIDGKLMDFLGRIRKENESVRLASRELARANIESKLWKSTWLPTVDLDMQVGYLPLDVRPTDGSPGFKGALIAKFDLFQGFKSSALRNENEARRMRAEADLKFAIQSTLNDAEVAFRRLMTIQKRVDLEEKNADLAEKYYKAIVVEYRRGVKNSADMKAAADNLLETRLKRETFKHDFLEQRIALERSLGAPVKTEIIH